MQGEWKISGNIKKEKENRGTDAAGGVAAVEGTVDFCFHRIFK